MNSILLLGTSLISSKYFSKSMKDMGYKIIFLLNIDEYYGEPRKLIMDEEYYLADVNSANDIMNVIDKNNLMNPDRIDKVVAITSLLDETLHHACVVAEHYGIAGPDPALKLLVNKASVGKIIPEFTPPTLTFFSIEIANKKNELFDFLEKNSTFTQFILKPSISSGAVGILVVDKVNEHLLDIIQNHIKSYFDNNCEWVFQPRIKGRLYGLEGFVDNQEAFFLGFTKRTRKNLTEICNEFPVDSDLSIDIQNRCENVVKSLINRAQYCYGYFHCEFIINENSEEIYLIDSNAGRISGGTFVEQCSLFYGIETENVLQHVIDLGVFNGKHQKIFQYNIDRTIDKENRTFNINYCLEKSGHVIKTILPENMKSFHTTFADNAKFVSTVGSSDCACWVGFLAGWKKDVLNEVQNITIETDMGIVKPFYVLDEI